MQQLSLVIFAILRFPAWGCSMQANVYDIIDSTRCMSAAFPPWCWRRRGMDRVLELSPVGLRELLGLGLTAPHKQKPPRYDLLASSGTVVQLSCDTIVLELGVETPMANLLNGLAEICDKNIGLLASVHVLSKVPDKLHKPCLIGQLGPQPVLQGVQLVLSLGMGH